MRPAPADATWKAARDFEAIALGELLRPMFQTLGGPDTLFGGGEGEETWRPMLVDEMARKIASSGGLGLAGPVYAQMLRAQEASETATQERTP